MRKKLFYQKHVNIWEKFEKVHQHFTYFVQNVLQKLTQCAELLHKKNNKKYKVHQRCQKHTIWIQKVF